MLTFLDNPFATVVRARASGRLTHTDCRRLIERVEQLIHQCGKARVLLEFDDCRSCSIRAAWDDLQFAVQHRADVDRCAVIGEKKWQKWMTHFCQPFLNVRYFERSE